MSDEDRLPLSEESKKALVEVFKETMHEGFLQPKYSPSAIGIDPAIFRRTQQPKSPKFEFEAYPPEFWNLGTMYLDSYATAMLACCSCLPLTGVFTIHCSLTKVKWEKAHATDLSLDFWYDNNLATFPPTVTSVRERGSVRLAFAALALAKEITTREPSECDRLEFTDDHSFNAIMPYPGYMKAKESRFLVDRPDEADLTLSVDIALSDEIRKRASIALDFAQKDYFGGPMFCRGEQTPRP